MVDLTSWGYLCGFNQVTLVIMVDLTMSLSFNHVVDLTSWGHRGGFNQVTLVLMVDLTMCPFIQPCGGFNLMGSFWWI
jgi:hypothetical protein